MTTVPLADEKKTLTEDILGEFGFRVVWSYNTHIAHALAYAIEARGCDAADTPLFRRKNGVTNADHVLEVADADVYVDFQAKWDGCTDTQETYHHGCDEQHLIKHCMLLRYLWQRAHSLLEASDFRDQNKAQN